MQDEYDDLELEDALDDEGYVDPMDEPGYGSVGPTKAAAAAGDINYMDNPGLKQYEQRQINAVQALRDARARAVEALKPKDDKSRYLALAAGFLAPTRTGGFGESISNAVQNYLPYQQAKRQEELGYQGALSKYDMDIAQAEYESAMKPPTFTDIYVNGKRQKVAIINGQPVPVGGQYEGARGGQTLLDKVLQLQQMTPEQRALWDKYGRSGSQTQIDIDLHENKNFGKVLGGLEAETYNDLQKAGLAAPNKIANYQRLGAMLSQIPTGKFRGTINEFSKALETVGISPSSLGINANTTLADAANAMGREMALQLRNPAGGAGMPGALSDSDRRFLESMIPGLETTPGAVPLMVNWQVKMAKRDQQVAQKAREYRKTHNGVVDEGFYDMLYEWSEKNPLFSQEDYDALQKLGAGGGAEPPPRGTPEQDAQKALDEAGYMIDENGKLVKKP